MTALLTRPTVDETFAQGDTVTWKDSTNYLQFERYFPRNLEVVSVKSAPGPRCTCHHARHLDDCAVMTGKNGVGHHQIVTVRNRHGELRELSGALLTKTDHSWQPDQQGQGMGENFLG